MLKKRAQTHCTVEGYHAKVFRLSTHIQRCHKKKAAVELATRDFYGTASSEPVQASEVDSIKEKEEDGYVVEEILGAFIDEAAVEPFQQHDQKSYQLPPLL